MYYAPNSAYLEKHSDPKKKTNPSSQASASQVNSVNSQQDTILQKKVPHNRLTPSLDQSHTLMFSAPVQYIQILVSHNQD